MVVPSRNPAKAKRALSNTPQVEQAVMDLLDPASIHAFADSFLESHRRLHILINNAGIMAPSIHALAICDDLVRHARSRLEPHVAQSAARDLAAIAQDVGQRIGSNDGFPWREIAGSLVNLSLPQALATCARFHEIGLTDLDTLLEPVIFSATDTGTIDTKTGISMVALLEWPWSCRMACNGCRSTGESRSLVTLPHRRPASGCRISWENFSIIG